VLYMQPMATADRYSRIVLWLKVTLPLLALAILSTLFFVAETLDPEAAIPYADVDVAKILREQGITQPTFGGVTADGVSISLWAESIRPDEDRADRMTGRQLVAHLNLPSGTQINIDSDTGIVDAKNEEAILTDGARLESSLGYLVTAPEIVASMSEASVIAPDSVKAEGPPGQITAGRMELMRADTPGAGYVLVFKGGVRLVYTPGTQEDP
jgi:lipopolysaccharide export system protein LptC